MKSMNQLMKHGKTMTLAVVTSFFAVSSIYACNSYSEDSAEAKLAKIIQKEIKKDIAVANQEVKGEVTFYFMVNKDHQIVINSISGKNEAINYAVFKQFDFVIKEEEGLILTGINGNKIDAEMLTQVSLATNKEFPVKISFQEGI